jgi:hypothetical protein
MKNIINLIGFVIIAATLAAVSFVAINRFSALRAQEVSDEARFQCAQSSRYQVQQSADVTVWYPVADLYSKCLVEKGIQ